MIQGDENFLRFKNSIIKYPLEGLYIYGFEKDRITYADGWDNVVVYSSAEINMLQILQMSSADFTPFVQEINDKALISLHERNECLTEYFFQIEIKIMRFSTYWPEKDAFENNLNEGMFYPYRISD